MIGDAGLERKDPLKSQEIADHISQPNAGNNDREPWSDDGCRDMFLGPGSQIHSHKPSDPEQEA